MSHFIQHMSNADGDKGHLCHIPLFKF